MLAVPLWELLAVWVVAAICWYVHWRFRTGRYFMSRFTTAEREQAKLAWLGPFFRPAGICVTAVAILFTQVKGLGLPTSLRMKSVIVVEGAVILASGVWAVRVYWRQMYGDEKAS